jgi:carbon storage regulator
MLVLTRKKKQSLMLGEDIEIQVLEVNGEQVRLGIKAPRSLKVYRREIYDEIHAENQAAAQAGPGAMDKLPSPGK